MAKDLITSQIERQNILNNEKLLLRKCGCYFGKDINVLTKITVLGVFDFIAF